MAQAGSFEKLYPGNSMYKPSDKDCIYLSVSMFAFLGKDVSISPTATRVAMVHFSRTVGLRQITIDVCFSFV